MRVVTPPVDELRVTGDPHYIPKADEVEVFTAAARAHLPVVLRGPTGTGKTRFVTAMAHRLGRPLVTVACHDDLTSADLVGRYLIVGDETVWMDGPLTAGVRHGAIVYLDEVVEARRDTLVVIHPLTDDRRILPIDKLGVVLRAPADFMLVMSYNPGYQSALHDLKPSTRQRLVALDFTWPDVDTEADIVAAEAGVDRSLALALARLAARARDMAEHTLAEGPGTRLLVLAAALVSEGVDPRAACRAAIGRALSDDPDLVEAVDLLAADLF